MNSGSENPEKIQKKKKIKMNHTKDDWVCGIGIDGTGTLFRRGWTYFLVNLILVFVKGMVLNISKRFPVKINTRTSGKAVQFAIGKHNIEACEDVNTLAQNCQIIVICVTDSPDVVAVAKNIFPNAVRNSLSSLFTLFLTLLQQPGTVIGGKFVGCVVFFCLFMFCPFVPTSGHEHHLSHCDARACSRGNCKKAFLAGCTR